MHVLRRFRTKILHTLLRAYAHVDGYQWQSNGNPTAISYQIISFAGAWTLGNVYARVTVIYGIPRGSTWWRALGTSRFLEIIDDWEIVWVHG